MKIQNSIKLVVLIGSLIAMGACSDDSLYDKEMYDKVLCLLSDDDQVFAVEHSLEENGSMGNLSVSVGGSKKIEQDVVINFEYDHDLLAKYNKKNFDINYGKYVKLLPASRYTIPSMTTTMYAGAEDSYVLLPVKVWTVGLSPDTVYAIPMKVSKVSAYSLNVDKSSALYRVYVSNKYATQYPLKTTYGSNGTSQKEGAAKEAVSGTRTAAPIKTDQIRVFAGGFKDEDNPDAIMKNTIIIQVNSDNTLSYFPYGTIDVEAINDNPADNVYVELTLGDEVKKTFYLAYKYRTARTPTDENPSEWSAWTTVFESLRRSPESTN